MNAEVIRTGDFVAETTDWVAGRITAVQAGGGTFRLSLCGGSTPGPIYLALARRDDIDWNRVILTFGDERCVGPDDEQSNYRMVKNALIDPSGIALKNVIRMAGEMEAEAAAAHCEGQLKDLANQTGEDVFKHDLILLGMGDDGHTASLFPGTDALQEKDKWVVANYVPKFDTHRITFTYPLIAAAKEVAFLVNGKAKHAMADTVLEGNPEFPASQIEAGKVFWFIGS